MLADRKTKSRRALIAFRFLKLNLFVFKFGKLIPDSLHEVLFPTWVRAAITMGLRRVVARLPCLNRWRLRIRSWDFDGDRNARRSQAFHRRFLFV
jgi:hypothetical protein